MRIRCQDRQAPVGVAFDKISVLHSSLDIPTMSNCAHRPVVVDQFNHRKTLECVGSHCLKQVLNIKLLGLCNLIIYTTLSAGGTKIQ